MTKRTFLPVSILAAFIFCLNGTYADVSTLSSAAISAAPQRAFIHKYKNISYWVFFPKDYGEGKKQWPMIVYLHGASERGKSMASLKQNVTYHFFDSLENLDDVKDAPFIVVAPRCPAHQYWSPSQVKGVVDDAMSYCNGRSRPHLSNRTQYGGIWDLAGRQRLSKTLCRHRSRQRGRQCFARGKFDRRSNLDFSWKAGQRRSRATGNQYGGRTEESGRGRKNNLVSHKGAYHLPGNV